MSKSYNHCNSGYTHKSNASSTNNIGSDLYKVSDHGGQLLNNREPNTDDPFSGSDGPAEGSGVSSCLRAGEDSRYLLPQSGTLICYDNTTDGIAARNKRQDARAGEKSKHHRGVHPISITGAKNISKSSNNAGSPGSRIGVGGSFTQRFIHSDDTDLTFSGYNKSRTGTASYVLFVVITAGLGLFIFKWFPLLRVYISCYPAPLSVAGMILVKEKDKRMEIVKVRSTSPGLPSKALFPVNSRTQPAYEIISRNGPKVLEALISRVIHKVRYFEYQKIRFIYNDVLDEFDRVTFWCDPRWKLGITRHGDVSDNSAVMSRNGVLAGLSSDVASGLLRLFGHNEMNVEVPSILGLIWDQICTFFTVFQIFSMLLWTFDEYYQYAQTIFALMVISVGYQVYTLRKGLIRARDMARFSCLVNVLRDNSWVTLNSSELVPGDLYQVSEGTEISPCDALLLTGACTVSENVLTGESIPLLKVPATSDDLKSLDPWSESFSRAKTQCPKSTIYMGSRIIRSRSSGLPALIGSSRSGTPIPPLALVLRTGFDTMKGSLVRLVLYPRLSKFKHQIDAFKFVAVLFFLSVVGLVYSMSVLVPLDDSTPGFVFVRVMDIFTVAVPPALPATLSIGTGFAIALLVKRGISCFSSPKVPEAGKTDIVIFDKTGTITESSLSVLGIQPSATPENPSKSQSNLRVRFIQCDSRSSDESVDSSYSPLGCTKDQGPILIDEMYFRGSSPEQKHNSPDSNVGKSEDEGSDDLNSCVFADFYSRASQVYCAYSVDYKSQILNVVYKPMKSLLGLKRREPAAEESHRWLLAIHPTIDFGALLSSSSDRVPPIIRCMSSCHAIMKAGDELAGDFMDVEMFNFALWEIHELNSMEYNTYRGFETSGQYDPNEVLIDELSVASNSDYTSTLELLYHNGSVPSLALSPYLMQIVNVEAPQNEMTPVDDLEPIHIEVPEALGSGESVSRYLNSLCAIVSRLEILTIKSFEFSSASRRMSVVTKRSTIGKYFPLSQFQGGIDISNLSKNRCLEIDPNIIYRAVQGLEDFERFIEPQLEVYIKGAPENVRALCTPSSIPCDFEERLAYYSRSGYRVIACAYKRLEDASVRKILDMSQDDLERNSEFAGFIVFDNKLKPTSRSVCSSLEASGINQYICSGDNLLTSINVARQCGVIKQDAAVFCPRLTEKTIDGMKRKKVVWEEIENPSLKLNPITLVPSSKFKGRPRSVATFTANAGPSVALRTHDDPKGVKVQSAHSNHTRKSFASCKHTVVKSPDQVLDSYCLAVPGDIFQWLQENVSRDTMERILVKASVYARMLPHQKFALVEEQQASGHTVLFVGDGANDIAALRAADVGLSLSGNESSMAAPFVSSDGDPSKALDIIRCCRSAFVTSFCCFKYMALYSLIQFVTVLLLYTEHTNVSDPQLLIIDIAVVLPLATAISISRPSDTIHKKPPVSNLVGPQVLTELIGQTAIQAISQVSLYLAIKQQSWYEPPSDNVWVEEPGPTRLALFSSSLFLYLAGSLICCAGRPHRQSIWKNYRYSIVFFIMLVLIILLGAFSDSQGLANLLDTAPLPTESKVLIIMISLAGFAVSVMYNKLLAMPIASAILRYIERVTLLQLIDGELRGHDRMNGRPILCLFTNARFLLQAFSPSSIDVDGELLFRARALYNARNKMHYKVSQDRIMRDIERERECLLS